MWGERTGSVGDRRGELLGGYPAAGQNQVSQGLGWDQGDRGDRLGIQLSPDNPDIFRSFNPDLDLTVPVEITLMTTLSPFESFRSSCGSVPTWQFSSSRGLGSSWHPDWWTRDPVCEFLFTCRCRRKGIMQRPCQISFRMLKYMISEVFWLRVRKAAVH